MSVGSKHEQILDQARFILEISDFELLIDYLENERVGEKGVSVSKIWNLVNKLPPKGLTDEINESLMKSEEAEQSTMIDIEIEDPNLGTAKSIIA